MPAGIMRRQRQCLDLIANALIATGVAPTLAEIAAQLGQKRTNKGGAHKLVLALCDVGLVERIAGRHRALALTPAAWRLYAHAA
jgi:SOS-response transcriptional repressor LexA